LNKTEAEEILASQINYLRQQTYVSLKKFMSFRNVRCFEMTGESGAKYQIEIESFWDGKPEGDLRVLVNVDDGGIRAFCPCSDGFIISPSGVFVGET
jgi:hypothetical protein